MKSQIGDSHFIDFATMCRISLICQCFTFHLLIKTLLYILLTNQDTASHVINFPRHCFTLHQLSKTLLHISLTFQDTFTLQQLIKTLLHISSTYQDIASHFINISSHCFTFHQLTKTLLHISST